MEYRKLTKDELETIEYEIEEDGIPELLLGYNTKEWYWYSNRLDAYLGTGLGRHYEYVEVEATSFRDLLNPDKYWIFGNVDL